MSHASEEEAEALARIIKSELFVGNVKKHLMDEALLKSKGDTELAEKLYFELRGEEIIQLKQKVSSISKAKLQERTEYSLSDYSHILILIVLMLGHALFFYARETKKEQALKDKPSSLSKILKK